MQENHLDNKYYTPSIDEFYVGFEYEQHDPIEGTNMKYREWVKKICDIEFFYTVGWYTQYDWSLFRIKYLDREDIESLGFTNYIPPHEYDHTWSRDMKYELKAWFNTSIPVIRISHYQTIIFQGVVKNKSELKKLLKMLNIM